jgi:hypothetical protein
MSHLQHKIKKIRVGMKAGRSLISHISHLNLKVKQIKKGYKWQF